MTLDQRWAPERLHKTRRKGPARDDGSLGEMGDRYGAQYAGDEAPSDPRGDGTLNGFGELTGAGIL